MQRAHKAVVTAVRQLGRTSNVSTEPDGYQLLKLAIPLTFGDHDLLVQSITSFVEREKGEPKSLAVVHTTKCLCRIIRSFITSANLGVDLAPFMESVFDYDDISEDVFHTLLQCSSFCSAARCGYMDVIFGALRHEPRISPSTYHSILASNSSVVAIKEGHLPVMLKALAEEPRIRPSNYHSILSSDQGRTPPGDAQGAR